MVHPEWASVLVLVDVRIHADAAAVVAVDQFEETEAGEVIACSVAAADGAVAGAENAAGLLRWTATRKHWFYRWRSARMEMLASPCGVEPAERSTLSLSCCCDGRR